MIHSWEGFSSKGNVYVKCTLVLWLQCVRMYSWGENVVYLCGMSNVNIYYRKKKMKRKHLNLPKIVYCWNNCSGYSLEKCFKCNLAFPKLSRLKKGQRVKGFWSQGRKKGTEGKVFEAEAVGRGWEMFPRFPFFYRGFKMFTSCPSFFNQDALG